MKFHQKAIIGTIIYLTLYQIFTFLSFIWFPEYYESLWLNQLIFATSTSLGAVFWSLFIIWKYQKYANLENLITNIYGDLEKFQVKIKKFSKLMDHPLLGAIMGDDDDDDDEPDMDELMKKYVNRDRNED